MLYLSIFFYFYIIGLLNLDWLLQDGGVCLMQERGSYLACCVYILGQSIGKCSISDPQPLLGSGIYADLKEAPLRLQ